MSPCLDEWIGYIVMHKHMYLKRASYTIDLAMSSLNVAGIEEWSGECGRPERVEFKCTQRSEMCSGKKEMNSDQR